MYTYILGQDVAFPNGLFSGGNRWLGITVGVDPEMTPRQQLLSSAYSLQSQHADSVNWSGLKSMPAGFADGVDNNSGGDITAVNTSSGLTGGTTSGDANLSIATGGVTSTHIGDGQIVNADINANAAIAASKISGTAATLGGIQTFTGKNTFADSVTFDNTMLVANGKVFLGDYPSLPIGSFLSIDRFFYSTSTLTGIDVTVGNSGPALVRGGSFSAHGTTGNVFGISVQGLTDGHFRRGVYAEASTISGSLTTGTTFGVQSVAMDGAECFGVHGVATRGTKVTGVYGSARLASQEGVGVHGIASDNPVNGLGVYGGATANGWGVGVYGEAWANSTANWAGYFGGDVNVTGVVYSPAKVNRIDHPLDPGNKYLMHATVESSEMTNLYSGNVTLNAAGEAVVTLPDWFEAANTDFRYQLTCVGGYAPVFVARKISNHSFNIAGGSAGLEVSWQVTAVRNDQYARSHPLTAEEEKRTHERGKYLYPESFGLGEEQSIDYESRRRFREMNSGASASDTPQHPTSVNKRK
jgi:hypothetical protein